MEITINVNINAPELSSALLGLASAISASPLAAAVPANSSSKSEFSFKLDQEQKDTTEKPESKQSSKKNTKGNKDSKKDDKVAASNEKPEKDKEEKTSQAEEKQENTAPPEEPKESDNTEETPAEPETKPEVTLEQVRAKLADLSKSGKQTQVKMLITDFGAKKLTDIPEEKYPELLAKAEEL